MIAIEAMDGSLVKVFKDFENMELGFHQFFGFISSEKAKANTIVKKKQGFDLDIGRMLCTFKIVSQNGEIELKELKHCSVKKLATDSWAIELRQDHLKLENLRPQH